MDSKFFTARKIGEKTTIISGLATELCYLIEGTEKALLVDSLSGAGNLKSFVREITDLPVTLVNTHGHPDHAGGNFDFGECFIHYNDISLIYECDVKNRKRYVDRMIKITKKEVSLKETDFSNTCPIKTLPVNDGYIFNLGGRKIEVIAVPGHTLGSIVLLDQTTSTVFSGDACNANTLLLFPHSSSIEEYKSALLHFKSFQPYFEVMYSGHGLTPVPKTVIDEAIELCEEIMQGTDDKEQKDFMGHCCYYGKKSENYHRLDGKIANIAYNKENIFKRNFRAN
ncbi:MAG: MBL fold metallo-hydrolase [Treponema sp.]|jgi:glyoxylase-like metal-dependent hydrolase (beta-lactamase superfamily II)|nr:MBL fold metallo-hydrolase [Treponema sp.]